MPRIDHVAVESRDPAVCAAFYERFLGARIVRTEGHPVMAYLGALMCLVAALGAFLYRRRKLESARWFQRIAVVAATSRRTPQK